MTSLLGERKLPHGLDPALPDLGRILDPLAVAARFQERLGPGYNGTVAECSLENVRWSPGEDCMTTWSLVIAPPNGAATTTMGAVLVDGNGVRCWLWTEDPKLPGAAAASDPARVGGWLSDVLATRVEIRHVELVRYRPRKRCVLRYTTDDRATVLYGKILAGERCLETVSRIGALGAGLVAPIVAAAPEWQLVVQRDAGNRSLRDLAYDDPGEEIAAHFHASGRLLASLHGGDGPAGLVRRLEDDAASLREYVPFAERVDESLADRFRRGVEALGAAGAAEGSMVPSHGAFRVDQVRLGAAGPRLIDLDTFCHAERERDAGNLLAYLEWRHIRGADSFATITRSKDAFLSGYKEAAVAPLDELRLGVFTGASMLKVTGRCCRNVRSAEWDRLPALVGEALARIGAESGGGQ
jgi:hypothetical protein